MHTLSPASQDFVHSLICYFAETNFLQWGDFEDQIPSDQPPILNHTDQDLLADFFSDPNSTTQSLIPYDVGFAGVGVQQPGYSGSQAKSHVNSFSGSAGAMTNNHELNSLSAADFTAAQTINGFKTPATWGAFSMPLSLQNNNQDMSSHANQHLANNRHLSMAGPQRQHFIAQAAPSSIPFSHPSYQSNAYEQHAPPAQYDIPSRQRNPSLSAQHFMNTTHHHQQPGSHYNASQVPGSQNVHGHPMPQVNYGTDDNFAANSSYKGPAGWDAEHEQKRDNLLGIPLVRQASQSSNTPVQHSGIPPQTRGGQGSSWANMPQSSTFSQTGNADEGRDRKRRKSQMDGADAGGWSPVVPDAPNSGRRSSRPLRTEESEDEEAQSVAKRRRHGGYVRPTGVPKSPANRNRHSLANGGDVDDVSGGRAGKKARETLSEQQKREHHIESEKKRREIINRGYSDLNMLVPCLNNGKSGLSRAECLQEVASYIETLVGGTEQLMAAIGLTDQDLIGPAPGTSTSAPPPPPNAGNGA